MANTILVEVKNIYGNKAIYPACEVSKNLARLAGTKTLTDSAIDVIKQLGYTINVKQNEVTL